MIIPVILCGGIGERLWPVTSQRNPKQFLPLFSGKSLYDLTIERSDLISNNSIIVASQNHKELLDENDSIRNLKHTYIFEQIAKNTTAAIWFGAKKAFEKDSESNILIMPSDHYIQNNDRFKTCINESEKYLNNHNWVIFGIKPSEPSTSFGYIKTKINNENENIFSDFIEKPSYKKANEFFTSKNYFWNSGMFLSSSKNVLVSIKKYATDIFDQCQNVWDKKETNKNFIFLDNLLSKKIRSESIDYSVIEKEKNIFFRKMECDWNDLGSWDTISKIKSINFMRNFTNSILLDSENTEIFTQNNKVACVGVKDLVVVSKDDVTLIFKKGTSQEIRKIKKYFENN